MKSPRIRRIVLMGLTAATIAAVASPAFAQDERETARENGPAIRHQLLYRSTRLELAPMVGMTVADSYLRNTLVGAELAYHLTNSWGLALVGGFGVAQFDTDLRTQLEATLEASASDSLDEVSYSYIKWLAGAEIQYAPVIGKFSLFDSAIVNYDVHLVAGFSFVGEQAQPARDGGETDPQLDGLRPAPAVGVGARMFVSDGISVNVSARDYLYSSAGVSTQTADSEFGSHLLVTVGLSFFLPQDVQISR